MRLQTHHIMKIEGVKFIQELLEENISRMFLREHAEILPEDILEMYQNNQRIFGHNQYATLIVSGEYATISNEARKVTADLDQNGKRIASAIVVKSPAHRLVTNFFIKVNRPKTPTRSFTTEEKALEWLREQVKTVHSERHPNTAV